MRPPVLVAQHLSVRYGAVTAVDDVTLVVNEGEIVGVIGPNGAGKSSLLRAIIGLAPLASGEIQFLTQLIHDLSPHDRVQLGLGYAPERARIISELSVEENLLVGAHLWRDAHAVRDALEQTYSLFPLLAPVRHTLCVALSGGMRQMVVIGRALLGRPRVLLLDEPLLGLADDGREVVIRVIRALPKEGISVVAAEHDLNAVAACSERIVALRDGTKVYDGDLQGLLASGRLEELFYE